MTPIKTHQYPPNPAKAGKPRVRLTVWLDVVWSTTLTCELRHG